MPPWPRASSSRKRFFSRLPAPLLNACSASSLALAKPAELLVVLVPRYWVYCVAGAAVAGMGGFFFVSSAVAVFSAAVGFLCGFKTVAFLVFGLVFLGVTVVCALGWGGLGGCSFAS